MNTANHLSQDDLALFALQLLPEEETADALTHLQHCDQCRREVGDFQGDLVLYSMLSELHTPPALARERLLSRVAREKQIVPAVPISQESAATTRTNDAEPMLARRAEVLRMSPRAADHRPRNTVLTWTGWALAAGFAAAAFLQFHERQQVQDVLTAEQAKLSRVQDSAAASQVAVSALTDPAALNVTLRQPTSKGAEAPPTPEGHAAYLPDRGALVFIATNLQPLEPYKMYELWLLPAGKDIAPIPAGSFRPDAAGNANIILPTGPKFVSIKGFGVTREDDNLAPKQPTLPILLMGSSRT